MFVLKTYLLVEITVANLRKLNVIRKAGAADSGHVSYFKANEGWGVQALNMEDFQNILLLLNIKDFNQIKTAKVGVIIILIIES